ncbi:F-box/LRR-repeat protein [Cardamine amara subsp. amara]|uniref:F-box/LRR-repeat protein n=1 Tax=Cardamine amara subsp. amara TaxID=228776 RepID=A0ABD1CA94_CARAN
MDRISHLPDEIIQHIGSFLSAKEAAFTTVLSKRWINLFTIITYLQFDCMEEDANFTDFVDRVLALPASHRVRKCFLNCCMWLGDNNSDHAVKYDLINRCLRDVLKRGVLVFKLLVDGRKVQSLPFELFTCETITKLSLGCHFAIDNLPENALLPALKTLYLDTIMFFDFGGNCAFKMLLDACVVLEDLTICGVNWELWRWSRIVSSLSIKRLYIIREDWPSFVDSDFQIISFHVPNLEYLYYSDVPKHFLNVNLNSLVRAKLHLRPGPGREYKWEEGDETRFQPMNLIHGLRNVAYLNMDVPTLEMFTVFRESLPVFEKLFHLYVNLLTLPYFCWVVGLHILIQKSPNLKILTINGPLHYYRGIFVGPEVCPCLWEYSFLMLCPLEVLIITVYKGCPEELIQMKLILEKLSYLKEVKVHSPATGERKLKLIADLEKLPRASSMCEFKVVQ